MRPTNTPSCRISGFQRTTSTSASGATMCHTMCGSARDTSKPRKAMSFTTVTLKSSLKTWVNASTSGRSPSIAGALCRWCRTWRAWALRSFLLVRASRISVEKELHLDKTRSVKQFHFCRCADNDHGRSGKIHFFDQIS